MRDLQAMAAAGAGLRAAAHVTGGGLPENLPRALPAGLGAELRAGSWELGPAIEAVLATGRVDEDEAWRTFNMGLGHVRDRAATATRRRRAVDGARVVGRVAAGEGVTVA